MGLSVSVLQNFGQVSDYRSRPKYDRLGDLAASAKNLSEVTTQNGDTTKRYAARRFGVPGGIIVSKAGAQNGGADATAEAARVTPSEYLMREHAILERILIIYESGAQHLTTKSSRRKCSRRRPT